jgi:hypothetical protein
MLNVTDKITNTLNFYHKSETITEDLITMFEETIICITNVLSEELDYDTRQILVDDKLKLSEIVSDLRDSYEAEESLRDYDEMTALINNIFKSS